MLSDERPNRKTIHHTPPFWVPDDAIFFITINCLDRGKNHLAKESIATQLIDAWLFYREQKKCSPLVIMVMPDHLHMLISFSWQKSAGMNALIKSWKRYTAKQCRIKWQRDFFDHHIRNKDNLQQKWDYIMNNPIHANLVTTPDQWAHKWINPTAGQSEYI